MEAELYTAIKTRLNSLVPSIGFIAMYNNQVEKLLSQEPGDYMNSTYDFPRPAVFIQFVPPQEIQQLGNGVQIYDPLVIVVHILHEKFNDLAGNQEENLEVFALKQLIFKALNKFEPAGASGFARTSEEQDYDHTNLYWYKQEYTTNYIDAAMMEPVDGVDSISPVPPVITASLVPTFDGIPNLIIADTFTIE